MHNCVLNRSKVVRDTCAEKGYFTLGNHLGVLFWYQQCNTGSVGHRSESTSQCKEGPKLETSLRSSNPKLIKELI